MEKLNYIEIFKVPKFEGGGSTPVFSNLSNRLKKRVTKQANKEGFLIDPNTGGILGDGTDEQQTVLNSLITEGANKDAQREAKLDAFKDSAAKGVANVVGVDLEQAGPLGKWGAIGVGGAGKIADIGMQAAGALTTGDKNFSELSKAVDAAVGATTSALMKSGNPYLMAAAGGITAINELTKMGGQSVPGFEVDISSSGYGNLGSMEESSSRGFFNKTEKDLKRLDNRNEKASLALAAASISDDLAFEQEARMNSLDNVVQNNLWALNGGVSTDLLAAKHGAKLNKVEEQNDLVEWMVQQMCSTKVESAKNGAKLNGVEVSDSENVLPTGDLHKNKHNLDLDNITKKGIPVILNIDDSVLTFAEVKQHEADIVQSAEIESLEIILNKEVTDFIEERMDKAQDREVCKEVGLRLCKEILFNTKDKEGLINNINEKENGRMDASGLA